MHESLVIGYWLLVIGYWLLVIGYWLLATNFQSLRNARAQFSIPNNN
ncbi:D-galactonate transporter [Tychonema sp. LEGE 06208]